MRTILAVGLLGVAAVSAQTYAADELLDNQITFADNQLDELVFTEPPVQQSPPTYREWKDRIKAGFRKVHDIFHDSTSTKHGFLVENIKAAHEKAQGLTGTSHATVEEIKAILNAAHVKAHALTGTIHNEEKLQAILKAAHEKAHVITNTKHASLEEIKAILQAAHEKFHQATGTKHAAGETADNQLDELVFTEPPVDEKETPKKSLLERAKERMRAGFNKVHDKFHNVTGTKHATLEDIKAILKAAHEKAHELTGIKHDEERFKTILKAAHEKAHQLTSTKHYTVEKIEEILKAAHEKLHQATGIKHSAAEDSIIKAAHDKAHALTGTKHPEEGKAVTA